MADRTYINMWSMMSIVKKIVISVMTQNWPNSVFTLLLDLRFIVVNPCFIRGYETVWKSVLTAFEHRQTLFFGVVTQLRLCSDVSKRGTHLAHSFLMPMTFTIVRTFGQLHIVGYFNCFGCSIPIGIRERSATHVFVRPHWDSVNDLFTYWAHSLGFTASDVATHKVGYVASVHVTLAFPPLL